MKLRHIAGTAIALAVLTLLSACGGGSSSGGHTAAPKNLYVSNAGSSSISGFGIDASSGALTAVGGSPFPETNTAPTFLATNGTNVFFASQSPTGVGAATIGSNGALSNVSLLSTGTVNALAMTPDGSAVLIADATNRTLGAFKASNGTLTAFGKNVQTDTQPTAVLITPNGKFIYVVNGSIFSTITHYNFDATTGDVTTITPTPTPNVFPAPANVGDVESTRAAMSPTGHYLVANSASGYLYLFVIAGDGTLSTNGQNIPVNPYDPLGGVAIDPTGKFVYVTDRLNNMVYGFSFGSSSFLTAITGSPWPAGHTPISVTADSSGKFAYVVNQGDNTVSAYSIGKDGALTALSPATYATGTTPVDVAVTH